MQRYQLAILLAVFVLSLYLKDGFTDMHRSSNKIVTGTHLPSMKGVRIKPANHDANTIRDQGYVQSPEELMQGICLHEKLQLWRIKVQDKKFWDQLGKDEIEEWIEKLGASPPSEEELKRPQNVAIFGSSFRSHAVNHNDEPIPADLGHDNKVIPTNVGSEFLISSENGLVWSVIYAYSGHHHLTLRPEDIWFAILTQFSAYINQHAEEFRHLFVAHQGKLALRAEQVASSRYVADYGALIEQMSGLVQEKVIDAELRDWIMPDFSTTTYDDKILAGVLMMASMQKYFEYTFGITCGLPSVTLLGERQDYERILHKIDRLARYGDEPTHFASLLRPVIKRFISSFDDPTGAATLDFWQRVVHEEAGGSGPTEYSGWITAFCFWDKDGNGLYRTESYHYHDDEQPPCLELDGVRYGRISHDKVPSGYSKVPVEIDDNGVSIKAELTAGSVSIKCSSSSAGVEGGSVDLDSMQPLTAWWIAEV